MSPLLLALVLVAPGTVERDTYGVPRIRAGSFDEAFFLMGKTVAEDRLWQMENSRKVALGRSAELIGPGGTNADRETLKTGYTDAEYDDMFAALPDKAKLALKAYARGVNETIDGRKKDGTLPPGYKDNGIEPEPWTVRDSMAIEVMLSRRFGTGGAGELRNYALYLYLKTQPVKDRALDVIDDFAWQNDAAAVPTVSPEDDPLDKTHVVFPSFTREQTVAQLEGQPKVSLFDLAPAIRAANGDDSRLIAQSVQAPFETGSYCIAVSAEKSANGRALLLSGPQMGFTIPSIVHEVCIECPDFKVAGIDVPGIPFVVIGNTPNFAWGLTTGVADTADIVYCYKVGDDQQVYGKDTRPVKRFKREIKVKGGSTTEVEVVRTADGPVVLESRSTNSLFSQRMACWKQEVASWSTLYDAYAAKSPDEIERAVSGVAMNMNFFYATIKGDIGWRYLGRMPVRKPGYDPRFPLPSKPETDWTGFLRYDQMPHARNPKTGLLVNWNNKPVSWWPNLDTPVWGSVFRNAVLLASLKKAKLSPTDLEKAVWDVAHKETDSNGALAPYFARGVADEKGTLKADLTTSFDGWFLQGSTPALLYRTAVSYLRRVLFAKSTGNFTSDTLLDTVAQPSLLVKALDGKTKFDYLAGRKADEVAREAVDKAFEYLSVRFGTEPATWPSNPGAFGAPGELPVYYSNRGTYIQVTELAPVPFARSVAPPGVTETGEFSAKQVSLARQWTLKPMWRLLDATAR